METAGSKPTRFHLQSLIWRDTQTHSCGLQSVTQDPMRSPVQNISKQLVPKHRGLLDTGQALNGLSSHPTGWPGTCESMGLQGSTGRAGQRLWGLLSHRIQVAMLEISLTAGRSDSSHGVTA